MATNIRPIDAAVYLAQEWLDYIGTDLTRNQPLKYTPEEIGEMRQTLEGICETNNMMIEHVLGMAMMGIAMHDPAKAERARRVCAQAAYEQKQRAGATARTH
jgi:hypothetical protein